MSWVLFSTRFFLESAKDNDNKKQLKIICEKYFGRKLHLKISSFQEGDKIQPPVESSKVENGSGSNAKEDLDEALINEALSIFNGKIVEVKNENLITK